MAIFRSRIGQISFDTFKEGAILFAATSAVSLLNYLFHVVQSRLLGPQNYATLEVLISLFATLSAPAGAPQSMLADYVARFRGLGEMGRASRFSRSALKWLALGTLPVVALIVLGSRLLADYLRLGSIGPVLVLATAFLPALLIPALSGILQGLERFRMLALVLFVGAAARLAAGVILVAWGWGASGGVAAFTVSGFFSVGLALYAIRQLLRQPGEAHHLKLGDVSRYGGSVLANGFLFATLLNLDVVLVKHYFDSVSAGYYAAAATVGKMVFFVPGAVGMLMFSKVSAQFAAGGNGVLVLRKSILVTLGLCGGMCAALILFPGPVTRVLFGPAYAPTASLVGAYGILMALFAVVNLLMLYHVSAHDSRFIIVMGAGLLLEWVGITVFHRQLVQVIIVAGVSTGLMILVGELWLKGLSRLSRP
jgi:O-antigen/teichoic acid export membrane protein